MAIIRIKEVLADPHSIFSRRSKRLHFHSLCHGISRQRFKIKEYFMRTRFPPTRLQ